MAGDRRSARLWPLLLMVLILLVPVASYGQGSDDEPELALPVLQEARALAARGELEPALEKVERALTFARAESGRFDPLVGFILDDLATLNYRLGRLDEALARAEEALAVLAAARGPSSTGHALVASNLASILIALERPEDALPLYQDALVVLEQTLGRTHSRTAATARNLATVQEVLGDHAAAVESYGIAIDGWRELDRTGRTAARLMVDRAEVLLRLNRAGAAAEEVGAARALLEQLDPAPAADLARADLVLADLDLLALRPLDARDRLLEAAARVTVAERPTGRAGTLVQSRLASIDLLMGRPTAAHQRLRQVLDDERRRLGPDDPSLGVLNRRLGEARLDQGDPEGAADALEQAFRLTEDDDERALATGLLALSALTTGEVDEAVRLLGRTDEVDERALEVLERASPVDVARLVQAAPTSLRRRLLRHLEDDATGGPPCRRAHALTAGAVLRQAEGTYEAAEEALGTAVETLDGVLCPAPTALEAGLALADFRLADGRAEAAIDLVRDALEGVAIADPPRRLLERALDLVVAAKAGSPDEPTLDLMLTIAQRVWSREQQEIDSAVLEAILDDDRPGTAALRDRRVLAGSLRARSRLIHDRHPVSGADVPTPNMNILNSILRDDLDKLNEIDRDIREAAPELARLLPDRIERSEVQAALGPGEAALLQVTGPTTSHLFLLQDQSVRYAQTSMGRADLEAWVDAALAEIATSDGSFDSFALHALYVGLVGPFADALGGISHLIVLGDGAARRLPLIALTTKPAEPVASGTDLGSLAFLIEQVAISTIQDLTALTLRRSPSAASIVFAGFAAPGSAEVPAPDPARVARLQAIAASLTADRALLDLQAAKKGIMALDLGLYRTLAFAMPVALDGDGLPALAVTPGAVDDGRQLGVRNLARLDLDADLVLVLDDGQNPPAGTWAPSALLPAFAVAGARALLTTYWAVGADPVSRIMGPAVQAMLNDPERPPAVALQDAIRPLIGGEAGPAASQPAFWAPFGVSLATR